MTEEETSLAERMLLLGRALDRLDEVLALQPITNDMLRDAAIQRFEFCAELSWKCMAAALRAEGKVASTPRAALQGAYKEGWVANEEVWVDLVKDRNRTSHTYREDIALEVLSRIPRYRDAMRDAWTRITAP